MELDPTQRGKMSRFNFGRQSKPAAIQDTDPKADHGYGTQKPVAPPTDKTSLLQSQVLTLMGQVKDLQSNADNLQILVDRANSKPSTYPDNGVMPPGDKDFQMLVWYKSAEEDSASWHLVDPPVEVGGGDKSNDVAFLGFNRTDASTAPETVVKWVVLDSKYKVAQRSSDDKPIGDYVRLHA